MKHHAPGKTHGTIVQSKQNPQHIGELERLLEPIVHYYSLLHRQIPQDAEDARQDILLWLLVKGLPAYDPLQGGGYSWLQTVTRNHLINQRKKQARQRKREVSTAALAEDDYAAPEDTQPEATVLKGEMLEAAACTLADLSEQDRYELIEKGKNRGRPRAGWQQACLRAVPIFATYYPDHQ